MVRELIDMELDAVSGGRGPLFSLPSLSLSQTNSVTQSATAKGRDGGNNAVNAIGSVGNLAEQVFSF